MPKRAYALDLTLRGLASIPELRRLDPEDAYRVMVEAHQAARNEKDAELYRKVVDGYGILLILCVFFLLPFLPALIVWLTGANRLLDYFLYFAVCPPLAVFLYYSRIQRPKKLRPYIVEILRNREHAPKAELSKR